MELARKRGESMRNGRNGLSANLDSRATAAESISPYVMMIFLKNSFTKRKRKKKSAGLLSSGCKGFYFYIFPIRFFFIASNGFSGRAKKNPPRVEKLDFAALRRRRSFEEPHPVMRSLADDPAADAAAGGRGAAGGPS